MTSELIHFSTVKGTRAVVVDMRLARMWGLRTCGYEGIAWWRSITAVVQVAGGGDMRRGYRWLGGAGGGSELYTSARVTESL